MGALVKINGDEVELVTDFATLGDGVILWRHVCRRCSGNHRGILNGRYPGPVRQEGEITDAFWFLPTPKCAVGNGVVVDQIGVKRRYWYRVIDPQLGGQTTERKREAARS